MNQKHCQKDPLGTVPTSAWRSWGVRLSAPLGAPQGTSAMHQGAEELGWVPKAFEDPCRGNWYPERLLGPCPHTVTLSPP